MKLLLTAPLSALNPRPPVVLESVNAGTGTTFSNPTLLVTLPTKFETITEYSPVLFVPAGERVNTFVSAPEIVPPSLNGI